MSAVRPATKSQMIWASTTKYESLYWLYDCLKRGGRVKGM